MDGSFFLRRYRRIYGTKSAPETAADLHKMCCAHLYRNSQHKKQEGELYRIFFYDCPPMMKKAHHPITGRAVDFSKTDVAIFRNELLQELRKLRKVAVRLGYIDEVNAAWMIKPDKTKALLKGDIQIGNLQEEDVIYEARQKAVDMRIGLDIASIAYKEQVQRIVLVAGDSDFVPAAKLARREGIDFILDPMWSNIKADLYEHIDGLRSTCKRPAKRKVRL
ncbi:MAG: NYN domain-containing protein [Mariprofundaceae bacterium]